MHLRWFGAFKHSLRAIRHGFIHEAALREEMLALLISLPIAILISHTVIQFMLLVVSVIFLIIVEALNTAIEAVCDRITTEHDALIGIAKDYGSLAVLGAFLIVLCVWLGSAINYFLVMVF